MKKFIIILSLLCLSIGFYGSVSAQIATHVVLSEFYGGGGNTGATYKNDFIELYNPTNASVSLAGWSVQYASATGTTWQVTNLSGSIAAYSFYLVQEAQGAGGTTNLPTPDATGIIAMSGTNGKVALVNTTTALTGSNPLPNAAIIDFMGFGSANGYEGSGAMVALTNTTSGIRKAQLSSTDASMGSGGADELAGNGWDTNVNSADFIATTSIGPQNSASTAENPSAVPFNDGAGSASVVNVDAGIFNGLSLFNTFASTAVIITVTGVSAGNLDQVQATIPGTWGSYDAGNVTLGGAFSGKSNSGTGNDILITSANLGTTPGTITITGLTSPNTSGSGNNGNDSWTVKTAKPSGTLTNIATLPVTYTMIPISNLRSGGADNYGNSDAGGTTPVLNNNTVLIHGVITVPNGVLATNATTSIIIQEGNYGMQVFKSATDSHLSLLQGDEIYVKGLVQAFNGNTEVVPSSIASPDLINIGAGSLPSPFVLSGVSGIGEANESRLVQLNSATWDSVGQTFISLASNRGRNNFNGGAGVAYVNSANTTIFGHTIPTSSNIIGVVYHRTDITGVPSAYKLAPRTGSDIGLLNDGTGTAYITPTTRSTSMTAVAETLVIKGDGANTLEGLSVTIPSSWSWPSPDGEIGGPGLTTAMAGFSGDGSGGNPWIITVTGAAVTNTDSAIIILKGLNTPSSGATTTFTVKTKVSAGSLSAISSSPVVTVSQGPNPFEAFASGNWNQASVWYGGQVPGASDNVTFTTKNVVVTMTENAECNNLTMTPPTDTTGGGAGAVLQFASSGSVILTVNGRLDISGTYARPKLFSNGNNSATLNCKGYVFTSVSNTTANGDRGITMNEGTVRLFGTTSDTLKTGAGLRLGNLIIGDGTNPKTVTWVQTSTATLAITGLTVRAGASFIIGGTTYANTNAIGNFSTAGFPMLTGGVTVESGASLTVNDATSAGTAYINIKNGGFSNSGTVNLKSGNGSRKYFVSFGELTADPTGSRQEINGNATGIFSFVKIGALDTLTLNHSMTIGSDSVLFINGELAESNNSTVHGIVKATRVGISGVNQTFGGIGFSINDAATGTDTTYILRNRVASSSSILRYFDVNAKTKTGLNAQIVFKYDNADLGDNSAATLGLWMSTDSGGTWTYKGGSVNMETKTITVSGVTSLPISRWTAADASHPLGASTNQYSYADGWNMLSLPMTVVDNNKTTLFPTALSNAFAYVAGYVSSDVISNGVGYWLKFNGSGNFSVTGVSRTLDSITVATGWNLVGSISSKIASASVTSIPGGLVTSPFYAYSSGYTSADSIHPGKAYWVKVSGAGKLVFATEALSASNKIHIVNRGEIPPPPPGGEVSTNVDVIPTQFGIGQNYPNPFNPATSINFQLPTENYVTVKVYNLLGSEVATLVDGIQSAGYKSVKFDASSLTSGVYIYRITATSTDGSQSATFNETKRMILMK